MHQMLRRCATIIKHRIYDNLYRWRARSPTRKLWNNFQFTISRHRLVDLRSKLVLTYDNTEASDGVGAQLQRIFGIYSISRLLGASYLHTPLRHVGYQGLSALAQNVVDPGFHHKFNDLLQIQSDSMPTTAFHKIKLQNISLKLIHDLVAKFNTREIGNRPILVQLCSPYGIAERFPDCWEVCREISPFPSSNRDDNILRIAMHVRRGDLYFVDSWRMLPNAYYISVAQNIAQIMEELEIDYQIELHSEVPNKQFIARPDSHGIVNRTDASIAVSPDLWRLDEFSVLPKLVHCLNEPAIDCLSRLATADILVLSRSSFSFIGGILNGNNVILYHPFWHSAPSSWIIVDPDGKFDQMRFKKAVASTTRLRKSLLT